MCKNTKYCVYYETTDVIMILSLLRRENCACLIHNKQGLDTIGSDSSSKETAWNESVG